MTSMIPLHFLIWLISLVMASYMLRHFIFTYYALFGKPMQRNYRRVVGVYQPNVTVLIPAHNEEKVIGTILERMTKLTYPKDKLEIVVIDDGSTDMTGEIADRFAEKHGYIKVIHRSNGGAGKPSAMNDGIKFSNGEIILTFDADYYPQLDIIEKLVAPFADPEVGAVQGRVTVANEDESLVSKIVTMERIGGYRVDQLARDHLILIPQYGGTVGGFRRRMLEEIGGWDPNILAEDTDLTVRCILSGCQIRYIIEAECYEEAVTTWKAYWRQRYRWAKGHMQCAIKHLRNVWKCTHLSLYEKIELTLLLCIYFMPVLTVVGWILGALAYKAGLDQTLQTYLVILSSFTYSTVGSFAPFFEVGSALHLDNRRRLLWLIPALTLSFVVMTLCCTKALIDLAISRNRSSEWTHTIHNGSGYNGHNGINSGEGYEWPGNYSRSLNHAIRCKEE